MNLTDPQQLAELLKSFGFQTNKDLGQNFLLCEKTLANVVNAANIQEGDSVLEIGPGPGVLTCELLKTDAKKVECLELDEKVIPVLQHTTEGHPKLTIHNVNALEFEPQEPGYILAANIPYYLTGPIIRHYLSHKNSPKRTVILVQKEVAERVCCKPNDETLLSLLVKMYGSPEIVSIVGKEKFFPVPKVDSAVLKIELFSEAVMSKELQETFWLIAKQAFSQKRKKMGNTLGAKKANKTKTFSEIFTDLGIDENRRPQTLSIEEWKKISEAVLFN